MLHDIMERQIDETKVGLLIGFHEPLPKVVYGRELLVIVSLVEACIVEEWPEIITMRLVPILAKQASLTQSDEELGVQLVHFLFEEHL